MTVSNLEHIKEVQVSGKTPRARQWAKSLRTFTEGKKSSLLEVSGMGKQLGVKPEPDQLSPADALNAKTAYVLSVVQAGLGADWPEPDELAPMLALVSKSVDDFKADIAAFQNLVTDFGMSTLPNTGLPADGTGPSREAKLFLRRAAGEGQPITEAATRRFVDTIRD